MGDKELDVGPGGRADRGEGFAYDSAGAPYDDGLDVFQVNTLT